MKHPPASNTPGETASAPVVATRAKSLERLVRLLARQAAEEYAAELRTREEMA